MTFNSNLAVLTALGNLVLITLLVASYTKMTEQKWVLLIILGLIATSIQFGLISFYEIDLVKKKVFKVISIVSTSLLIIFSVLAFILNGYGKAFQH